MEPCTKRNVEPALLETIGFKLQKRTVDDMASNKKPALPVRTFASKEELVKHHTESRWPGLFQIPGTLLHSTLTAAPRPQPTDPEPDESTLHSSHEDVDILPESCVLCEAFYTSFVHLSQWKRVEGTLFCVRAQRLFEERQLELGVDAQARISSDLEQQLQANASTIAALITDTLPAINRERFLVKSCRCLLERETTIMREPISIETRVAVGLYRLCSSAEDRTIAHLFGIGRSTVNVMYKDFCNAIIEKLEGDWLRMLPLLLKQLCQEARL
ncbi:hypothetical protein HPB47_015045 [Ixodes persulcatus]|uniref:Uncharacterized protein n=1 Tax=Ixodes persulcatus TaxID=34615 RepID=A0AC60QUL2_IXOPE|nr:hypothetical protein HPB47_015045 [Ixodes persulcatus]